MREVPPRPRWQNSILSDQQPVITTRQASAQDVEIIRALETILQSRGEADFAAQLFSSGRDVILGFSGDRPVGYVVLNPAPSYALFARLGIPELQDLNVLPADRGRGAGAALVAACENLARGRGATQIGLAVGLTKSYGPAQRLYVRMGYRPDGFGITYDRQTVTTGELRPVDDNLCLMMVRDL